ncbi:hypothetical protein RJ639_045274 [Escallonia herrerae]|uniref:DNA N(6)-methyladenine demethylase n=1 Tax=Escallonia herrerae TaxID=1293975 RepID=A0AA88W9K8_9ASTE|nr:hypothetical protein RJ639_045274 [Escallonia herrerae]
MSTGSNPRQFDCTSPSNYPEQQDYLSSAAKGLSSGMGSIKLDQNSPESVGNNMRQSGCLSSSESMSEKGSLSLSAQSDPRNRQLSTRNRKGLKSPTYLADTSESCFVTKSGVKEVPAKKDTELGQSSHVKTGHTGASENSDCQPLGAPFDICRERNDTHVRLKPSLLVKNREKRNEIKRAMEEQSPSVLRPGMILLKSHISFQDQVKIIKSCRELGLGSGGFYQPGYRDGAKLHLKMMCLGMNWEPETSKYADLREFDGAKPPAIPIEFHQLVKGAIQDSHAYLHKHSKPRNVEDILPSLSPSICIVNFYSNSGRLGLHQDKDETQESLRRRLPVVSISVGDSAEFLYGDQKDIEKAEKVILESGDVLIFGGQSRHIFHGVTTILPNTAPKALLEESNLKPGRLNLTFREY